MNDLVSRNALFEILSETQGKCETKSALAQNSKIWQRVKKMSTIDPVEHSKWIDIDSQTYTWKVRCSRCGYERSMLSTQGWYPEYCEACGAKMDGELE